RSDLVVSRSGAHITGELLALKKPCLLIPIPWVSHNEQYENAKILVDTGLGTILPEDKLIQQNLADCVKTALEKLDRKGNTSVQNHGVESAELIVQQLMSIVKKT
ncbi:MAG: glycosyltransferase, partial [Patescibacteria group bacterium]